MTDFGANIFGEQPPVPPPQPPAPPAPVKITRVEPIPGIAPPAAPAPAAEEAAAATAPEPLPTPVAPRAPKPSEAPPQLAADEAETTNPFLPATRGSQPHAHRHRHFERPNPRDHQSESRHPRHEQQQRPAAQQRPPFAARDSHGVPGSERRNREAQPPQQPAQRSPHAGAHGHQAPRPPQQQARPVARPPATVPPAALPTPAKTPAKQSTNVTAFLDLDALQAEARAQQAELAMARLRQGLAGAKTLTRAIAFTQHKVPPSAGIDIEVAGTDFASGVRLAGAAFALASAHGSIVLAPATPMLRQLATALREAGHSVELAAFACGGDPTIRQLGRECLFVP